MKPTLLSLLLVCTHLFAWSQASDPNQQQYQIAGINEPVEIIVDQWGIPVLKFDYKWSDYERLQAKHMHDTFENLIENMGGIALGDKPSKAQDYGLRAPGQIIHEVGTTRMGDDPKTSVTNSLCQLHDADNVFIVDAGPFSSQADKNCTWTILALSMRTSAFIVEEFKKKNI